MSDETNTPDGAAEVIAAQRELHLAEGESIAGSASPRRGRGRPKGSRNKTSRTDAPATEIDFCKPIVMVLSRLMSVKFGENMALTDGEIEAIGNAWDRVIDRYMPALEHKELYLALGLTSASFGLRLAILKLSQPKKSPITGVSAAPESASVS